MTIPDSFDGHTVSDVPGPGVNLRKVAIGDTVHVPANGVTGAIVRNHPRDRNRVLVRYSPGYVVGAKRADVFPMTVVEVPAV